MENSNETDISNKQLLCIVATSDVFFPSVRALGGRVSRSVGRVHYSERISESAQR